MRAYLYVLRVFSGFFITLMGLGLLLSSDQSQKFLGAAFAAAGFTFFWTQFSKS